MQVKFTLTMDDLLVNDQHVDSITFSWVSDLSSEEVLCLSQKWMMDKSFLLQRMVGLKKVKESSLTIEPLEEKAPIR